MSLNKKYMTNPFNNIIIGFVFFALGQTVNMLLGNEYLLAILSLIGWYYLIKGYHKISRKGLQIPFSGIYRFLFYFYIIQCVIMIIRGYLIDYNYQWISLQGFINFHLFSPFYILPYLMPLTVFIPHRYYNLALFIKYSRIFAILLIVIFLFQYNRILQASLLSSRGFVEGNYGVGGNFIDIYIPFAFAVLCKTYISKQIWYINCIGLATALLITLLAARRGGSAVLCLLFLFNFFVLIKSIKGIKKISYSILFAGIILCSIFYFFHSNKFSYIRERGMEDTRTGVDEALLNQMSESELIWGKGLNGRYYYPLYEDDYLNGWRYGSETGFYNILLKGGYLMAITYILLLLYPAILGIFKSKNLLSKGFGFYILLSLIELYPFGWLSFNIKFLIIWIGIALCSSPRFRKLNDSQIKNYLFNS